MLRRGKLTDRKIKKYQAMGYYDEGWKAARREMWARRRAKREGNFVSQDGRLIFRP